MMLIVSVSFAVHLVSDTAAEEQGSWAGSFTEQRLFNLPYMKYLPEPTQRAVRSRFQVRKEFACTLKFLFFKLSC